MSDHGLTIYVVQAVEPWSSVQVTGAHMAIDTSRMPGVGYLPVFGSEDEARLAYPTAAIVAATLAPGQTADAIRRARGGSRG